MQIRALKRLTALAVSVSLFMPLFADTLTWKGDVSAKWNEAGNWTSSGTHTVPQNGDTLVFPNASKTDYAVENDVDGLTLALVKFTGAGGTVSVSGKAFTLDRVTYGTTYAIQLTSGGSATIANDICLAAGEQILFSGNKSYLTLDGVVSGPGKLVKTGDQYQDSRSYYALVLNGINTYTGGTEIRYGIIRANNAHACGDTTKEIYFNHQWPTSNSSGGFGTLRIGTADDFPYPLRTYDTTGASPWGSNSFTLPHLAPVDGPATLTGPVTGGHLDLNVYKDFSENNAVSTSMTFEGPVTTRGIRIYGANGNSDALAFKGAVTNRDASITGTAYVNGPKINFYSPLNEFNGTTVGGATHWYVYCRAVNVLNGLRFDFSNTTKQKNNALYLNGYSQVIDRVKDSGTSTSSHVVNGGTGRAVLTMRATNCDTNIFTSFTGNLSLVWDPTNDYTYVCKGSVNSTAIGTITVKGGVFRTEEAHRFTGITNLVIATGACADIANTTSGAFTGLKAVTLAKGATLALTNAVTPLKSQTAVLTVGGTAETCGKVVVADADETVTFNRVFYGDGVDAGWYTGADDVSGATKVPWISGAGKVYVAVSTLETYAASWSGGAGAADTRVSTGANWNDPTVVTKLGNGTAELTFATVGGEALVDSALDVKSVTFATAHTNAFTLKKANDAVALGVEAGGLTFGARTETGTYVSEAPVAIHAGQTWSMGEKTVFKPEGGVTAGKAIAGSILSLTGKGKVILPGEGTTYDRAWTIACAVDAYGTDPFGPGTEPVKVLGSQSQTALNLYGDVTITRSFDGSDNYWKNETVHMMTKGQTVRFKGPVNTSLRFHMSESSHVIFEGGGSVNAMPMESNNAKGSTIEFTGKPCWIDFQNNETRYVNIIFNVASNRAEWIKGYYAQDYTFNVDWAFYEGNTRLITQQSQYYGVGHCDLKGTKQRVNYAGGYSRNCWYTNSADTAATVYMTCQEGFTNSTPFKGEINLVKEGGAVYRFATNVVSTSTGALTNLGGRVEFAKDASWAGTAVTVDATKDAADTVLALQWSGALSRNADLVLTDGTTKKAKVEIAEGVVATVRTLTVNGRQMFGGTYGSSSSSAEHKDDVHFAGKGVLRVRSPRGLAVIVR